MDELIQGFNQAIELIIQRNPELWAIVTLSLRVSGIALIISSIIGIPIGAFLALGRFAGRHMLIVLMYTGMGFPPVVIGLFVYILLSRNGILGQFDAEWLPRLFTPGAMILAQTIISFPLVAGFTMAAVLGVEPQIRLQVRSLGATRLQTTVTTLTEARVGVLVAVIAGFGSIISEVGAVMIVGGNIENKTRVLTTAIVLETQKGAFDLAIALGIILLGLSFMANFLMLRLQGRTVDE